MKGKQKNKTKNKKNKKNRNKKTRTKNKKIRHKNEKGGASLQQIGEAAVLRNWFPDDENQYQLNAIVHSSDKHSWLRTPSNTNPYADINVTPDPRAESLLSKLRPQYKEKFLEYNNNSRKNEQRT